jgi:WD40 repeat protein
VSGLAFAPDGATLAAGGRSGLVRIWLVNPLPDPTLAAPAAEFPAGGALSGLAFLPSFAASFPTLVTLNEGGQLGLWNIQDGSLQYAFQAVPSTASGLAIAPSGDVAAIAYQAGLALVELGTYTTSYPGSEQAASALAAAFSPDGLLLAAAMQTGTIQIWGIP